MKKLDIPFYKNDEAWLQCVQVIMKTAIKYFLNKDYSLEELDEITWRKWEFWTWYSQAIPPLYNLWLYVKEYVLRNREYYLRWEEYVKELLINSPEDAKAIIDHTDMSVFINSVKEVIKYNAYENKKISINDLEEFIDKWYLVVINVDWNILYNITWPFEWHALILTGYDKNSFYYHESGPTNPEANRIVQKNTLTEAAWLGTIYQDIIIVSK